ncbi:hypothetical protein M6B24_14400 [Enterobacter bugandensis]|nr:hypothetical protein [Enterobacter bugandensis]
MSTITKEWLRQKIAEMESVRDEIPFGLDEDDSNTLAALRIALASLEAEAVADVVAWSSPNEERTCDVRLHRHDIKPGPLYTAPLAPVSVPDEMTMQKALSAIDQLSWQECTRDAYMLGWNACRAAMLQGADNEQQRKAAIHDALCKKYNVESLADFVDWQRNHIAELEAAPPAPVGPGETAVMPDYPGYVLTQRECYQAGKKAGLAEAGKSPVIPDGGEHGFCHKHPDTRLLTHPYIQLMTYPPRPAIYCPKCDPNVTEWVEMDKKLRIDN